MSPKSILIVKTSAIGDVIHTFPVLEYLRSKFPDAKIDWVVEKGIVKLLSAHPDLSEVIPIDSKTWRKALFSSTTFQSFRAFLSQMRNTHYDVLFDLQGNSKSALVTACAKAKVKVGYGWKCVREKSNLLVTDVRKDVVLDGNVRQKYLALVQGYFNDEREMLARGIELQLSAEEQKRLNQICLLQKNPCLMVAFGSKWPNKQLHLSVLQPFLKAIEKQYPFSFMVIYGNEEEKQIAQLIVEALPDRAIAVGELSLPLWQALMCRVHGVIAVDSAALHLCGTTATPSFSVFGPSLARVYKPSEERHVAFQGSCPYDVAFSKHCPKLRTCATGACMKGIKVDELLGAFEIWVKTVQSLRAWSITN